VCQTRAEGLGLVAEVVDEGSMSFGKDVCGVLVQYPDTTGSVNDYKVRYLDCVWGYGVMAGVKMYSRNGHATNN
jgi:hypothetical protein